MSLIFTETFCGGQVTTSGSKAPSPINKWQTFSAVVVQASPDARSNGIDAFGNGTSGQMQRILAPADEHATLIAGMAVKWPISGAVGALRTMFQFRSDAGATIHVAISIGTDNKVSAWRGPVTTGTLLGTSTDAVMTVTDSWYYLEAKVKLSDGSGTVEVKVDGTTVLSLTGLDTKNGGTKTVFDAMRWHTGATIVEVCDLYLCNGAGSKNNNFLNAPRVLWLKPNGNGSSSQGIGSDGNSTDNYLLVDDGPNNLDVLDYVDLAPGERDAYAFTNPPGDVPAGNEVYGAIVWSHAQKSDALPVALVHVAGSTDIATDPILAEGVYSAIRGVIETKPGGGAWTASNLDSMEFGVEAE